MEPLVDPLNDRPLPALTPPPSRPLSKSLLFPNQNIPDWRMLKTHLQQEGSISKANCLQIISQASQLFALEENLLELMDPITIIGDIHGQYYDLLKILEMAGDLPETKYLFLGDFVDRGSFSLEVILLLYSLKINYTSSVFMLRGNHECRQLTTYFNFRTECLQKYDLDVYIAIMESFDNLPLASIVNKKFLAVHGGISPDLQKLSDIRKIKRNIEPPRKGIYCDLLWADPIGLDYAVTEEEFKENDVRACSYFFGAQAANKFLMKNKLLSIIRAHEAQIDGYKMHKWNGNSEFPVVITIFSAPNYCDVYNNKGAILKFINNTMHVQQYNYSVHPFILPEYEDGFAWSIPFVIEKVLAMLFQMMKQVEIQANQKTGGELKKLEEEIRVNNVEKIKNKVQSVSKMMKMYSILRKENEILLELKGMCPDNKIPKGLLQQGREAILGAIGSFNNAKTHDQVNEKRPNN